MGTVSFGSALCLILGLLGVHIEDAPLTFTVHSVSVRSMLRYTVSMKYESDGGGVASRAQILDLIETMGTVSFGSALCLILGLLGVHIEDAPLTFTVHSVSVRSMLRYSKRVSLELSACDYEDEMIR
ncbi:hypothetical protein L1987_46118 [Smallanthus sonchifolius]|uniref:Uncharacterized protein n=1 Tax=Smallanthus sonchifolius TaxID=185202 RepID=A0ACB9FZU5_9ASTR|nr:hypothetical protein L1987_46118 [Smallanthus sonchifolius]